MKKNYDVIVAGAGPSGALLAFELATKGIDVLVLEKDILPRYKCCAGGVTFRAAGFLNGTIEEVMDNVVTDVTVHCGNDDYSGYSDAELIYTVKRDVFDHALINKAEKAGATVLQGQKVKRIEDKNGQVEVVTAKETYNARFVAGADGAHSVIAKALGKNNIRNYIVAINTEIIVPDHELEKWKSRIHIDVGCVSDGYAWVFPKQESLSVGIGCMRDRATNLKRDFRRFVESLGFDKYPVSRSGGGLLPICKKNIVVHKGRVLLLGDAAGFIDPLTGEGIYYAMKSAMLAAPVIEKCLLNKTDCLDEYQRAVDKEIVPEIQFAWTFQRLYKRLQSKIIPILRVDERIWRGCCSMVRGDLDYSSVLKRIGGLKGIYNFLAKLVG
jgi:geranylgeranyl reductase family protein